MRPTSYILRQLAREREVYRATGYAVCSYLLEVAPVRLQLLHADPDILEAIGWAWVARATGLDEKGWIHKPDGKHGKSTLLYLNEGVKMKGVTV